MYRTDRTNSAKGNASGRLVRKRAHGDDVLTVAIIARNIRGKSLGEKRSRRFPRVYISESPERAYVRRIVADGRFLLPN